ncbi:MAG: 50S ribosomal protein L19 [Bacteroidales bacterium]|nr:50S ribosomal protein L19 [Bacteroidales bacterium]MBQ9311622.1 50S ribosomal protein L19 [Bacteroidales bacterium]MBR1654757.1 50S ribosomal protein L19 [Clostridia bacterium]
MKYVESQNLTNKEFPTFRAGDTISVGYKIREGNKERVQMFQGIVIQISGHKMERTFTVRKISNGVGVERIFPMNSPFIDSITVNKRGLVRRARIYYLRNLSGKSARIKERNIIKK